LHAEPIATHNGARNQLSEGWKKYRSFKDVETVPIKNDSGTKVDGWRVYDNGRGDGVYGHAVKWPKTINGKDPGWRLTLKIRVVAAPQEPKGAIMAGVVHNGRSYTISFAKANEGYPIVELGREGAVTRVVLDDVDKWYHTYELEFDPKENNAKLLVDGKVRAQHYTGYDE